MRLILTILFFIPVFANATKYYVSNAGSDGNAGTSTVASWQHVSKVNTTATSGDSVFFNKGDTWNEQIIPAANNIYYGSYGTGNKPLITGFVTLSGMTNVGNVWSATANSSVKNQNVVTVNGVLGYKARTPNTGYLTVTSIISTTQIKISHTATSYVGAEIAIKPQVWIIDVSKILSQNSGASFDTLNLATAISGGSGTSYFIQNSSSFIDIANEWSYDSTSKLLSVYATSSPTVQYSSLDTLFNAHKRNNITADGLAFTGANKIAISIDSARSDTVKNCAFLNNTDGLYWNYTRYNAIISDSINYSLSDGIQSYNDTSTYVHGNYINHSGIYAGMGNNGAFSYTGIFNYGGNSTASHLCFIDNNKVFNSGYIGIRFTGSFDTVYHNYIDSFCLTKDDGGGVYTNGSLGNIKLDSGSAIISNIISNGKGLTQSPGIYLDDYASSVKVQGNTSFNNAFADIFFKGTYNRILNNTCYDSLTNNMYASSLAITYSSIGNILFNSNSASNNFVQQGAKDSLETIDSNYYMLPINPANSLVANTTPYSLLAWQQYYPTYDIHSVSSLRYGVTSNTPTLFINPTLVDSTITISQGYYDAAGNGYAAPSFVLPAFQSRILWPAIYNQPTFSMPLHIKLR